ncbi:MAG: class B sortase [Lachnospiraceae bacterium]|nr:class B sortase [Lachnospiraceae bacterium]
MKRFWIVMNIIYEKLMLFVFVVALLVVAYGLYDAWYVYHKAGDDSYLAYKPVVGEVIVQESPITDDMVAWITVDNTNIDYPVMQGDTNSDYLNLNPYGEYSLSGSIFLDSRNSSDFSDDYSILYGHHMEYGNMFGALDDFLSQSYLDSHSTGTLLVGKNNYTEHKLGIFACAKVNAYENNVLDPDTLENITKVIEENAVHINTSIEKSNHILALSTCTEPVSTNRLIVFCYVYD